MCAVARALQNLYLFTYDAYVLHYTSTQARKMPPPRSNDLVGRLEKSAILSLCNFQIGKLIRETILGVQFHTIQYFFP